MQLITCPDCDHHYPLDLQEIVVAKNKIEIGHECPACHTWYHSFFTSPKLKQQQALLARFKAKASRSPKHWQRYQRKKAAFKTSYNRLNPHPSSPLFPPSFPPPLRGARGGQGELGGQGRLEYKQHNHD